MTDTNPEKTPHVDYDDVLTIQLTRRELDEVGKILEILVDAQEVGR